MRADLHDNLTNGGLLTFFLEKAGIKLMLWKGPIGADALGTSFPLVSPSFMRFFPQAFVLRRMDFPATFSDLNTTVRESKISFSDEITSYLGFGFLNKSLGNLY